MRKELREAGLSLLGSRTGEGLVTQGLRGHPPLTGKFLAGSHFLRQGQRSSKSTPLAGFLLGERSR